MDENLGQTVLKHKQRVKTFSSSAEHWNVLEAVVFTSQCEHCCCVKETISYAG